MKIPFSVLYFSSDDTFFFYWRTGLGHGTIPLQKTKALFQFIIISMYVCNRESAL
jgi:hypothetical protein